MHILGYIFAIAIGLAMGLLGGGGSILAVPILVYIFSFDALDATTYSLFIVGTASTVGCLGFVRQGLVNFKTAFLFGIPSVLGILFSRRLVLPHLPHYIIKNDIFNITKEEFLLVVFALLMLVSSLKMIFQKKVEIPANLFETNYTLFISQGLFVGIITGLIGAGGGFLIVPALVMLLGMRMKEAIATSLFIIAINSYIGFLSSLDKIDIHWLFLVEFSSLSVFGVAMGLYFSSKLNANRLKLLFGCFILLMGIWMLVNELFLK